MDEMGVRYLMWLMRIWVVTRDPHDNVLLVVVIDRWRHATTLPIYPRTLPTALLSARSVPSGTVLNYH